MPVVFDSGALIGLERRDARLVALAERIVRHRIAAFVPAGVLAQSWRGTPRQYVIAKLMRAQGLRIHPLDEAIARQIGVLLGRFGAVDVVDAHVALLAASLRATVFTSDPDDIRALDDSLTIVTI